MKDVRRFLPFSRNARKQKSLNTATPVSFSLGVQNFHVREKSLLSSRMLLALIRKELSLEERRSVNGITQNSLQE